MIFETQKEKDVKQVGDIKNNNVSIDTSNIDFIVTILSTNLYSKPIESFIRETVSNAWDSHIEAGVDDPVILELGKDTEGNKFCRIQDFGVGLSPERFNSVYKNIGSSTKRTDNTQIGGFGIGRFSALAYSDVVHITSVFEGRKYLYMMYKDGNSISIDLLHEQDTTERNGLEVKVEIKPGDFDNFARAIKSQLVYFENLYIIDSSAEDSDNYFNSGIDIQREYNNFSIKKFNNFWVNTLDDTKEINLVLGKVRYPLRIANLDGNYANKISEYPISLKFDIGDLEVTPNREEILYSSKNKKVIEDKLNLTLDEVDALIMAEKTKDFTKFSEYLEGINNTQYLTLMTHADKEVKLKLSDSKRNLTLNGVSYDAKNFKATYEAVMNYSRITAQYTFRQGQIQYNNSSLSLNTIKSNFERVYVADLGDVKNITKRYIRETFDDNSYFIKDSRSMLSYAKDYIERIKDIAAETNRYGYNKELTFYDAKAFKVIFNNIVGNLSKMNRFSDSKVPQKWIIDTKAADKAKRGSIKKQGFDWKQNINVHELRYKDYGGGIMTDSESYVMKDLEKTFKSLTVYGEKDSTKLRTLYAYLKDGVKPKMIELAPTKVKLLENVDNFVNIEDFMSTEYKLIRNIGTVEFLKKEIPFLKDLAKIQNISSISEKLALAVKELIDFVHKYESSASRHSTDTDERALLEEIYSVCEEQDYFNEDIRATFNKHKTELLNARVLIEFATKGGMYSSSSTTIPENRVNLVVDYLLARKLIRPSVKAVLKLKNETIFNLKSEEDENNEN